MPAKVPETIEEVLASLASTLDWGRQPCRGRHCGAPLYWAKRADGRAIPIDAQVGLNHFITCPDRGVFRRRQAAPRDAE